MAENRQAPATEFAAKTPSLTRGLARNTLFNLLGWIWPIGLSLVSLPYILLKLGTDAYGIFAITSVVAGYLGFLNGPVAMGNVRFLAEAYAHGDWPDFRRTAYVGIAFNAALSVLGGLAMFLAAGWLAGDVFAISAPQIRSSITAFRLAAISFVLNGANGAIQSIPTAMRRYDILNLGNLSLGSLNTVLIVLALWRGWGLQGALAAQVFSSASGLALFIIIASRLLRGLPGAARSPLSLAFIKRLTSFSSLLFAGNLASQIGLLVDRTIVGILLSTSAVAYYTVPTKITDKIPGMMLMFCTALYPLSSEAAATGRISELRNLYHDMIRRSLWLSALFATPLLVLSKDLLALWIGPDFAANSWFVLSILAASVIWRSTGSVAYQICNGMGRADINLMASIGTAVLMTVPICILAPAWGARGVAMGAFTGLLTQNMLFDLYTQRKLLGVKKWGESLSPYARIIAAPSAAVLVYKLIPLPLEGWAGLFVKACLIECLYFGSSLMTGALSPGDVRFVTNKIKRAFSDLLGWSISG